MTDNNENIEANVSSWMPDVLGNGFHMCYVSQGIDYSGNVRCAIIRKKARQNTERGVLYIHGFSDYFFQKEMANRFIEQGYNFYAVDLRKYGRSFTQGQKMFQVRNLEEYFWVFNARQTIPAFSPILLYSIFIYLLNNIDYINFSSQRKIVL